MLRIMSKSILHRVRRSVIQKGKRHTPSGPNLQSSGQNGSIATIEAIKTRIFYVRGAVILHSSHVLDEGPLNGLER